METTIKLPDGKEVTLVHEGELTDDAIRNAVSQMGYDIGMSKTDIARNIAGEGTRIAGAMVGSIKGSKYGVPGSVIGGLLGAGVAELFARKLTPPEETTGESIANVGLAAFQPMSKGAGLVKRIFRGAATGAGLAVAHTTARVGIDEQRFPTKEELGPSAGIGAVFGGALEGAIGPRLAAKATEVPAVPAQTTKEGPITAALGKRRPESLAQANAEANEIISGKPTTAESAQATPKPTEAVPSPKRVSVDDVDAIEEAAAAQSGNEARSETMVGLRNEIKNKGFLIDAAGTVVYNKKKEPIEFGVLPQEIKDLKAMYRNLFERNADVNTEAAAAQAKPVEKPKGPETIKSAAVKFADGEVRTGKNHAEIVGEIDPEDLRGSDDGFVTNTGRYVSREEGMKIAKGSGQVEKGVARDKLAIEMMNEKPLPPETVFTHQTIKGKSFTQIDIPNPEGGRPIFSGSPADALKAGYKFNLPQKLPQGKATFAELTAMREASATQDAIDEAYKKYSATAKPVKAAKTPEQAPPEPPPGVPVDPTIQSILGDEPQKVRGLAKRVIASEEIPQETRDAVAADPSIIYSVRPFRRVANQAKAATEAELMDLIAATQEHDFGNIYRGELVNRLNKAGRYDEAKQVFLERAQKMTTVAQALAASKFIRTGFADVLEVEQAAAKVNKAVSAENKKKVLELATKEISAEDALTVAKERANQSGKMEDYQKVVKLEKEFGDAARELQEFKDAVSPRSLEDIVIKAIQGNLLTPLSLIANPAGNVIFSGLNRTAMTISSVMDALTSGTIKGLGALIGRDVKEVSVRTIKAGNPLPSEREVVSFFNGVKTAGKELITGPSQESYVKAEVQKGFRPWRSFMDSITGNNLPLNEAGKVDAGERTKAFIEGVIGAPPETMFRMLSLGDKPVRRMEYTRALMEQADIRGIKNPELLEMFLIMPPESARKIAEEASKRAVFAQSNAGIQTLNRLINSDAAKIIGLEKIPVIKSLARIFARINVPFLQFPVNYALTALDYAAPSLSIAKSAYYLNKARSILNEKAPKGMSATAAADWMVKQSLEYRRKGLISFGKAATGAMIYAAADILWNAGLLSEAPADTASKRSDQAERMGASKLNTTGLARYLAGGDPSYQRGDVLRDWTRMGIPAVQFYVLTNSKQKDVEKMEKTGQEPVKGVMSQVPVVGSVLDNAIGSIPGIASFVYDQSFLAGTNSMLEALKDPDPESPKFQNWVNNMARAASTIAVPNTVEQFAKAHMEFIPELRGKDQLETIENIMRYKTFSLPAEDRGLILKRDTWGQPLRRAPKGVNPYVYGLLDLTKSGAQELNKYDQALFDLYSETHRASVWPDPIGRSITFQGVPYELRAEDVEKLQDTIGTLRRQGMEEFVGSDLYERLDPYEKVLGLEKVYQGANEAGREEFVSSSEIYQKYFSSNPDVKDAVTARSTEAILQDGLDGQ
jgi:hypothetical protein